MAALVAGRSCRPSFIIPNRGYIENIDRARHRSAGHDRGRRLPPCPSAASPPRRRHGAAEIAIRACGRAAVTGSRDLALQALLIDPCVHSARAAEAFLDDVLAAHREYLPAFW
jgi:alpha-galactosidase/6-phospho-beta-glucosidase family protein